ncbi:MAG: NAD(P)H:quinone oxidoreductase [Rhodospirillaceae bacterium]|nr:NAD(P)H:quinone oxidoreductase [Rhodospirillaceae bacterium]
MTNILIAFYSRTGSIETLANAVADGAMAGGGGVRLRRAREVVGEEVMKQAPGWSEHAARMNALYEAPTEEDAKWADAIIFGTPTRFGLVSSELKAYIDSLGGLWARGRLNLKAGSVFTSTSSFHGGNEATLVTMFVPLAHFGMVIVPPGYADPVMFKAGTPYGASSVSGVKGDAPTPDDLSAARFQGHRVAQVAAALKSLRG